LCLSAVYQCSIVICRDRYRRQAVGVRPTAHPPVNGQGSNPQLNDTERPDTVSNYHQERAGLLYPLVACATLFPHQNVNIRGDSATGGEEASQFAAVRLPQFAVVRLTHSAVVRQSNSVAVKQSHSAVVRQSHSAVVRQTHSTVVRQSHSAVVRQSHCSSLIPRW